MKRKSSKVIPALAFIASIFFAIFILLEFRNDYLAVAGAGIVMLISAYFLVDKIERDVFIKQQIEREYLDEKLEQTSQMISEKCDRIENVQKAIYAVSKTNLNDIKEETSEIKSDIKELISKTDD